MRARFGPVVACLCLVAGAVAQEPTWRLNPRGAGPVRFGMTLDQASQAADGDVLDVAKIWECDPWVPRTASDQDLAFLVLGDSVYAAELVGPAGESVNGVRVGMQEPEVMRRLGGKLTRASDPYGEAAGEHWLVWTPPAAADSIYRVVFMMDSINLLRIRAGLLPGVLKPDGCP